MTTPTDRKYTKEHLWIQIDGNIAKVGITDFAQEQLGDIVYTELAAVGDAVAMGDRLAMLESAKTVSNIDSILEGKVVEVNEALEDEPERLNDAPYETSLVAVEFTAIDEAELVDAAAYEALIG